MSESIQMAHGGGGRLSAELIEKEISSRFGDGPLKGLPDGASLEVPDSKLIFSTDSFVVTPPVFPGGDIGELAVYGTVNDISVAGGIPRWLSLSLILEEGLELALLRKILDSVKKAADRCEVKIATGDTKVVARGQCDRIYINTAGVGTAIPGFKLDKNRLEPGDKIIISGPPGDHGMAVMTAREGINIENGPLSDSGPVHKLVQAASGFGENIRFMRDPTRGGVASVLNEIVAGQKTGIVLDEMSIPLSQGTKAVAEILGIDPLNTACEGRVVLICSEAVSGEILRHWKDIPEGAGAALIGEVSSDNASKVVIRTLSGASRMVDVPAGELLPRIC